MAVCFPPNSLVDVVFLFVCLPVCVSEFLVNHWQWGNDTLMGFTLSWDGAWLIWHQENKEENESIYTRQIAGDSREEKILIDIFILITLMFK